MVKILEDFDSKYERIHKKLQDNSGLVREIYGLAREEGLKDSKEEQIYFPCGSFEFGEEATHIGLDLDRSHNDVYFPHILANMRLIYEVSNGKADLSKVYAQLDDEIGVVSEDVSCGGKYKVWDRAFFKELDKSLSEIFIFSEGNEEELEKSTFSVSDNKGNHIRYPIIDLDHLGHFDLKPKWLKRHKEYREQYYSDDRFRIHEKI